MTKQNSSKEDYLFTSILVIAIIGLTWLFLFGHNNAPKKVSTSDSTKEAVEQSPPQNAASLKDKLPIQERSSQEIIDTAQGWLDKKAILAADVKDVREKSERQAALPQPLPIVGSSAPISPEIYDNPGGHPQDWLNQINPEKSAAQAKRSAARRLPPKIYATDGQSNTVTISQPSSPTTAPDPYTPPPMKVNPERVK